MHRAGNRFNGRADLVVLDCLTLWVSNLLGPASDFRTTLSSPMLARWPMLSRRAVKEIASAKGLKVDRDTANARVGTEHRHREHAVVSAFGLMLMYFYWPESSEKVGDVRLFFDVEGTKLRLPRCSDLTLWSVVPTFHRLIRNTARRAEKKRPGPVWLFFPQKTSRDVHPSSSPSCRYLL
jgi:hypothetical protein